MPARNRNGPIFAVASLIAILSAPVMAADAAAANAPSAQLSAQAPAAPAAGSLAKATEAKPIAVTLRPDSRCKYLSRYHNFILHVRCAHIGCPGVHTLGVAY
jgi:hypothetical protein